MNTIGILRAIRTDELDMIRQWRNEPGVRGNMYTSHLISADEHLKWWERVSADESCRYFMYEYEGKATGVVWFYAIDKNSQNAFWGFFASPDAPRGTGSRMERLALDYAFSTLKLKKLSCEVLSNNPAVVKLHLKFGFREEGLFHNHHFKNDAFLNIHRLAIFPDDWERKKREMQEAVAS
ncbi:UDP-4-amino-4,6-dideoxy-N-acetyl-beta-L-altrosamine N-acetyltransferase [Legionella sp. CNM-4043-24]|uniref:UDP-4-amino-4, 6-dideoxy-N-acetyl-beta-L-altrosamine N-acetyltransferase n=1 Tax=Legionella sp. CNM-4043-24 TaxID=3421646 RepID=UPI00403AFE71